jgi:hypothetical protein
MESLNDSCADDDSESMAWTMRSKRTSHFLVRSQTKVGSFFVDSAKRTWHSRSR